MKISTFNATCTTCHSNVDVPLLSDFSYGEFLYSSVDGQEIRYYCALECPTWKLVDEIIGYFIKDRDRKKQGAIIQKIIGLIADRDDQDLFFTPDIYCPSCHSILKSINPDQRTGLQEYSDLTFNGFERMGHEEKRNLLRRLLKGLAEGGNR